MEKGVAKKSNPALWSRIVSSVKSGTKGGDAGQWSARKSQLAVKKYKESGGKYSGKKSSDNSLSKWTKQEWGTKSGKPSKETGERYLPKKAISALTNAEYASTTRAKREGGGVGSVVPQPKNIAKKTSRYGKE